MIISGESPIDLNCTAICRYGLRYIYCNSIRCYSSVIDPAFCIWFCTVPPQLCPPCSLCWSCTVWWLDGLFSISIGSLIILVIGCIYFAMAFVWLKLILCSVASTCWARPDVACLFFSASFPGNSRMEMFYRSYCFRFLEVNVMTRV